MRPVTTAPVGESFKQIIEGVIELLAREAARTDNLEIIVRNQQMEIAKLKAQMKEWI